MIQQISAQELKVWQQEEKDFLLVDVRERWEHEAFNIGGLEVPLGEVMSAAPAWPPDKPIVLYCEKGIRSVIAIQRLQGAGFSHLYNLSGGMKAWRAACDDVPDKR